MSAVLDARSQPHVSGAGTSRSMARKLLLVLLGLLGGLVLLLGAAFAYVQTELGKTQLAGLVERQPESVLKDCGQTREKFLWYRDTFLTTRALASISNYWAADFWRYDWKWARISYDKSDPENIEGRRKREEITRRVLAEAGIHRG